MTAMLIGLDHGDVHQHLRSAADRARFKCALRIECGGCGNSKTLTGFEVATDYGTAPFAGIRSKMKCSRCGVKEARLTVLSPPEPR